MYNRISVPVDPTSDSEQALPLATELAKRANCPIDLVTSVFPSGTGTELYGLPAGADVLAEQRRIAGERLTQLAVNLDAQGVKALPVVLDGSVPHAIAEYVEQTRPDLMVMTTHDRNLLERLLLGSIAKSIVRHVHAPVLLVHVKDGIAMVPEEIRQILIPLDGSAFSEQVIPHATRLASVMKAEITLMSVFQPVLVSVAAASPDAITAATQQAEENEESLRFLLESAAERLRAERKAVRTVFMVDEDPARAIVDYANEHQVDTIAMTTHGRGGLKRLVAGSVSEKVLRSSRKPTIMFRPKLD
jgi:nucleotide-binding universal stress UspA family protein